MEKKKKAKDLEAKDAMKAELETAKMVALNEEIANQKRIQRERFLKERKDRVAEKLSRVDELYAKK